MIMLFSLLLLALLLIVIIMTISALLGVPFLPTNHRQAELMMELAEVGPGTTLVDLGSGAGRLLFLAAKRGAKAVGYELNPFLFFWTKCAIALKGLGKRVDVKLQSLYEADLSAATVVVAFLLNKPMQKLTEKLWHELPAGATIVSYTFPIPDRTPVTKQQGLFVYKV